MTSIDRRYGVAEGLAIKAPVRVATTVAISLSTLQTIDGVALAAGDRVLVKDQADTTQNGIFVASTGNWTRDLDFDGALDVVNGTLVFITNGAVNGNSLWRVSGTAPILPGTSAISFVPQPSFLYGVNGAITRTFQDRLLDRVSLFDFIPASKHAAIRNYTSTDDLVGYFQAAIDPFTHGVRLLVPGGQYNISGEVFLKYDNVQLVGDGRASQINFQNAGGGVGFAGATVNTQVINHCAITDLQLYGDATNGPEIWIDFTTFSYSDIGGSCYIQSKRANAVLLQGQGNSGSGPYYNRLARDTILIGDNDHSQVGLKFKRGVLNGGANGANRNVIGPIPRAAALKDVWDCQAGNGNVALAIGGEAIKRTYVRFNDTGGADESGTSSGTNGALTLNDTSKAWTVNSFGNYGIAINSGTGAGQKRFVQSNTATQLTIDRAWDVIPDNTSVYAMVRAVALGNKVLGITGEGDASEGPTGAYFSIGAYDNEVMASHIESIGAGSQYVDDSGAGPVTGINRFWTAGSAVVADQPNTFTANQTFAAGLLLSGTYTPTALAADVNNYNPTGAGLGNYLAYRIALGGVSRNMTGLLAGSEGRVVQIINIDASAGLTLKHLSGSSTAGNKFSLTAGTDLKILNGGSVTLRYDAVSAVWREWSGTLSNTAVTPGAYGGNGKFTTYTVTADGRLSAAGDGTQTTLNGVTHPASYTVGGIPWASGTGAISSSALLAQYGVVIGGGTGSAPSTIAVGTDGQILVAATAGPPVFKTLSGDVASVSAAGALVVSKINGVTVPSSWTAGGIPWASGTGALSSTALLAQYGLMIGGGTGSAPSTIAAGTDGQILVGVTSAAPVMRTLSGDISAVSNAGAVTVLKVTTAQYLANTASKILSTDQVWAAGAATALTDAATIAVDMSLGINFSLTAINNRTLDAPTNTKVGQSGVIAITQDGTGSRTLAYNAVWKFAGGVAPVLTTTASALDLLFYQVIDSTHIYATLVKDVK